MGRRRTPGLCRSCGGWNGEHRHTCRFNRCQCGAPATIGRQCGPCHFKARKEARQAERQAAVRKALDRLDRKRED